MYSYWGGRGTKQVSRRSLDIDGHGRGGARAFGCEGSYCSSEREETGVGWDGNVHVNVTANDGQAVFDGRERETAEGTGFETRSRPRSTYRSDS